MPQNAKKITSAIILTFVVLVIISGLIFLGILEKFRLNITDQFIYKENPVAESPITIVTIDDKSVTDLGSYQTWTREHFAKTLENINKYSPKVVGFDVLFKSTKDSENDNLFASILEKSNNIVLGTLIKIEDNNLYGIVDVNPINLFKDKKGVTTGFLLVSDDIDSIIRRFPFKVIDRQTNNNIYSFAYKISSIFLGSAFPANIPADKNLTLINFFRDISVTKVSNVIGFQSVSFSDVYNENYAKTGINPENLFKNKIVLIGVTSPSLNDSYVTPLSKDYKMPGVFIHANAIQTFLSGKFLRNVTPVENGLILLVLCVGLAFAFMYLKIRWSVLSAVGVMAGYCALAPVAFNSGLILDLVHPFVAAIGVFMAVYIYRYLTEFKEKTALKSAFSRYVNPKLAEEIADHPDMLKLGGEKRELSILFTDIQGFTSISEKLKPESLVALLNEYFEAMTGIILQEGGTLDKYEGDAIMAFFGAPVALQDHAIKACEAALKMRTILQELKQKWKNEPLLPGGEPKPEIDFRCGINSGDVIVGNLGSKERFNYTVIGDSVNLASRLEGANKKYGTRIMISEFTYGQVKDHFITRELDLLRVVGKNKPVKVYELLGQKGLEPEVSNLLQQYDDGIRLYNARKFAEALTKFELILKDFPLDGPSKVYKQRCEILRDFPPKPDWDGVFEMDRK